MIKIIISEKGQEELNLLKYDIENSINSIIAYVPKVDLVGLDHIYITDLPEQSKKHLSKAGGAYHEKKDRQPAYIELYIKRHFDHIKNKASLKQMLPILSVSIAYTIFHEIGHHSEKTRSHGIKKKNREGFADSYAKKLVDQYVLDNSDAINRFFDELERIAENRNLSTEILQELKTGWDRYYKEAIERLR